MLFAFFSSALVAGIKAAEKGKVLENALKPAIPELLGTAYTYLYQLNVKPQDLEPLLSCNLISGLLYVD